jgi:hypothetical protein
MPRFFDPGVTEESSAKGRLKSVKMGKPTLSPAFSDKTRLQQKRVVMRPKKQSENRENEDRLPLQKPNYL